MASPEKKWLDLYRDGHVEALGELVEHCRRPLFAFILRMTEGREDAEEIFQEVWYRALRRIDRYQDQNFLSWMFRITHNLIIDRARKKKPDFSLQEGDETHTRLEEKLEAPGLKPPEETHGHELGRKIAAAVSQLPVEQREVFLMRTEGDLPFKDIAAIQECSINTALARMQYALSKLRTELVDDYDALQRG